MYDFLGPPPKRKVGTQKRLQRPANPYDYLGPPLTPEGFPRYEFLQEEPAPDPVPPVPQEPTEPYGLLAPGSEATPKVMGLLDPELTRAVLSARPQIDGVLGRDAMGPSPERLAQLHALQEHQQQPNFSPPFKPATSAVTLNSQLEGAAKLSNLIADRNAERFVHPVLFRADDNKWGPVGIGEKLTVSAREAGLKLVPQVERNISTIVSSMTGGQFNSAETSKIRKEILSNIKSEEIDLFKNVGPSKDGVLRLDNQQWRAVKRLIDTFPDDELGKRVKSAYNDAVGKQRIRAASKSQRH